MSEKQHIQKYLVHFNKLSQLMGWNSLTLQKVFYNGLPERIQIKLHDLLLKAELMERSPGQ
jgi:hypothetical protein